MPLSVAYKSESLLTVVPGEEPKQMPVKQPKPKAKSYYTLMREERFKKAALKKFASRIKAIQEYYPGWTPEL